ncbi:MAG: hypothetical protein CMG14_02955 [Candidatus Marinimicrobia bacterium]|nr:hypothetical protein [Candidatus Neomarinimicrobiota bacterium]|tara:strand:+ start:246 stop:716 length:471 start_codon:yes stop_codon:yes gene_type:complete
MIDNRYLEQITDYIENTLNKSDKTEFELYMSKDSEFKKIVEDIKLNTLALKRLDDIEGPSDFVFKLNQRIDEYENSTIFNQLSNAVSNIFSKSDTLTLLSGASLILIVSFSFFKFSSFGGYNNIVDTNDFNDSSIAINDSDSLNVEDPILLLGNDK